ncbi:MAG: hypothetical protein IPH45_13265 [Bacteroidales bacterium]|nr:hypothetical protein [Bacteroidales bacterium]
MKIPFTAEQFFKVFENYNLQVFPAQVILVLLGITGLVLAHSAKPYRDKLIGSILGFVWIWAGIIYHIGFFASINKAANFFGIVFILQGLLIIWSSFSGKWTGISLKPTLSGYIGEILVIFGLLIYPIIGLILGTPFKHTISFGLPCPSTIATFGFFLLTSGKLPRYLLLIPSLWVLIGFMAALNFGVYQDIMLLISLLVSLPFLIFKKKPISETIDSVTIN